MPKNRLVPTLLVALTVPLWAMAQAPSDSPGSSPGAARPKEEVAPPTAAEKKIDEAIKRVRAVQSVSADLRVSADMLDQKFSLKGQYQKAPGNRVYLLLTVVGLADAKGTVLQVCDGKTIWDFSQVIDTQTCNRLTLKPILDALNKPECDAEFRENILSGLGFAGPEALLTGLRKSFLFDQMREGDLDGKPVLILNGTWKDTTLPIGPNGMVFSNFAPLPPYVPGLVSLTLGKDDDWPYQIAFEGRMPTQLETRKSEERELGPDGRPKGRKLSGQAGKPTKISLTYSNVKLNPEIPDKTFAFTPPAGIKVQDGTDMIAGQLDQKIAEIAARKKTEAAKGTPVLDGSLTAPAPTSRSIPGSDLLKPPAEAPR